MPSMYVNFIDAGVGGDTSAALLGRYKKDILSSPARIVHLLIGTNDSFDVFSTTQFHSLLPRTTSPRWHLLVSLGFVRAE